MESDKTFNQGVKGYVKPGYEHVLSNYEELFAQGHDKRSQLVVYVGSEKVIDLYGGVSRDNVTNFYSNGKTVGAIVLATLHDKGLF